MFIFAFVIIVALVQFTSSKALKISISNSLSYTYTKRDSLIIAGFFIASLGLQFTPLSGNAFWIVCGIYASALLMTMVVLSTIKKNIVLKQKEELQKIFEVLEPVFPKNTEFDPNNPPFKLGYEGPNVNRITISINPNNFKEAVATSLCMSLNKYLPNFEWVNEFDFAARECSFVGTPLPPFIAKYKGSWLRPAEFIPVGLSGLGEVSWNINTIRNEGRSNYIYDDGKIAKTVDTPSAPQCLTVGSPLGINTIIPTTTGYKTMGSIEVGDIVFDLDSKPVEVIDVHEVHMTRDAYQLTFVDKDDNEIKIISDKIHKFPQIVYHFCMVETMCKDLKINSIIQGNLSNFKLVEKTKVGEKLVRCITVNSDSHLFLITDKENPNWNGGNKYNYFALGTRNTGGGKAIHVDQLVETKDE